MADNFVDEARSLQSSSTLLSTTRLKSPLRCSSWIHDFIRDGFLEPVRDSSSASLVPPITKGILPFSIALRNP